MGVLFPKHFVWGGRRSAGVAIYICVFWLSLFPFGTAWMGENNFATLPVAFCGAILLFAAIAYYILTLTLIAHHGQRSTLATAIGRDAKGKISLFIYSLAIPLAFVKPWLGCGLYILVAVIWLIPDRRIEKTLNS
jgi:uncharacterized membrane protein